MWNIEKFFSFQKQHRLSSQVFCFTEFLDGDFLVPALVPANAQSETSMCNSKTEEPDTTSLLSGYRTCLIYLPTECLEHVQCAY